MHVTEFGIVTLALAVRWWTARNGNEELESGSPIASGKHTKSYWKWSFIVAWPIKKWWFSIVMWIYQRLSSLREGQNHTQKRQWKRTLAGTKKWHEVKASFSMRCTVSGMFTTSNESTEQPDVARLEQATGLMLYKTCPAGNPPIQAIQATSCSDLLISTANDS